MKSPLKAIFYLLAAGLMMILVSSAAGCQPAQAPAGPTGGPAAPSAALTATPTEPVTEPPVKANEILDPATITKFVEPLVIPPVMPSEGSKDWNGQGQPATEYRIAVRQFEQQVLPAGFPKTTVWGYGHSGDALPGGASPSTFNYPAFTIEARSNELVRVVWLNELVNDPDSAAPKYLPHLLPVDQTLHWANPGGTLGSHGMDPAPYLGPVPIIPHLHGAHVPSNSDGLPGAWFLPQATDLAEEFAAQGPAYDSVHPAPAGAAIFEYPNDQRAMTLWYHDHTLGMTRVNVYAGLAGFWILRDEIEDGLNLPGPAPRIGDPAGSRYYEIPIVVQDRTFKTDGSLFYPESRAFFDEYAGPYAPETDVSPIWNPEFFGNSIVVNGRTWPYLEVEPRLYRFRLLNGSNARFLILKFDRDLAFHQIGNEGGLLPDQPIALQELLMAPAERADVIVDFSVFKPGDKVTLLNLGPDSPFGNLPVDPADLSDPETTGLVMQFRLVELTDQGNPGQIPAALPAIVPLTTDLPPRDVILNEKVNQELDIPIEAQLGSGAEGPLDFDDDVTEKPTVGDTEIWRIINLTEDAHPIHLHLVHFQVLDRIPFDKEAYTAAQQAYLAGGKQSPPPDPLAFATGDPIPPGLWEAGWKETVIANPDMITRIIANFDLSGLYVWHCHILEHEDNEMMRPYYILPK